VTNMLLSEGIKQKTEKLLRL